MEKSFTIKGKSVSTETLTENMVFELSKLPEKYAKESYAVKHFESESLTLKSFRVRDADTDAKIPAFGEFVCENGNTISLTSISRRGNGIIWQFDEPKTGQNIAEYLCLLFANGVYPTVKISKIFEGVGKREDGSEFTSKTYIFEEVRI